MHYCSFEKWSFVSFCSVSVVSILDWLEAIVSLLIKLSLLKWYMLLSTVRRKPVTEKQLCWSLFILVNHDFYKLLCPTKPMLKGSISTTRTANFFQIRIGNLKAINKVHVLLIVPRIKKWQLKFPIPILRVWQPLSSVFLGFQNILWNCLGNDTLQFFGNSEQRGP